MKGPKVSICIPAYNHGRFLRECLASASAQEFDDYEIVLLDNASTDDTPEIAEAFRSPRLRYFRNETTISAVDNGNKVVELSRGEYISVLHADDLYLPTRLKAGCRILDENPGVGILYSACHLMDSAGKLTGTFPEANVSFIGEGKQEFVKMARGGHYFPACTVLVRREMYERVDGFDSRAGGASDMLFYMRCCLHGDVAYIGEPLAIYRLHGANDSIRARASGRMAGDLLRMYDIVFSELPPSALELAQYRETALDGVWAWALPQFLRGVVEMLAERGWAAAKSRWNEIADTMPDLDRHINEVPRVLLAICEQKAAGEMRDDQSIARDALYCCLKDLFHAGLDKAIGIPNLEARTLGLYYLELVFTHRDELSRYQTAKYNVAAMRYDPAWRRNRGAWSLLLRTVIGQSGTDVKAT